MGNDLLPYREADEEARARFAEDVSRERAELATRKELARTALAKAPVRRFAVGTFGGASIGLAGGGVLGGVAWLATGNPFLILGAAILGALVGIMVLGATKHSDDGTPEAPDRRDMF